MADRLTEAQRRLLIEVVKDGKYRCAHYYAPRKSLVQKGLVTEHEGRFGGSWIEPTDAGRAALSGDSK